jgi:hypothetical protein
VYLFQSDSLPLEDALGDTKGVKEEEKEGEEVNETETGIILILI